MVIVDFYDYHQVLTKRSVKGKLEDPDTDGSFNILCDIKVQRNCRSRVYVNNLDEKQVILSHNVKTKLNDLRLFEILRFHFESVVCHFCALATVNNQIPILYFIN